MTAWLTPARPGDARVFARILSDWSVETEWIPARPAPDADRASLERLIREADVITARSWRGTLGFLVRDGARVHALYVVPGARGRGLGRRLLDLAKSRSERLELWTFQANSGALRFYLREGFREAERTDGHSNDDGLPDVRLVWTRETEQ